MEPSVVFVLEEPQINFPGFPGEAEDIMMPFAPALVAICQDHFSFVTAEEDAPPGLEDPQGNALEQRLAALEELMKSVQVGLQQMNQPTKARFTPPRPKSSPSPPLPANLDPAVCQQALQAGISHNVLDEVAKVVGKTGANHWAPDRLLQQRKPRKKTLAWTRQMPPLLGLKIHCRRLWFSSQLELGRECNLYMSGTDMRDYHYCFSVSRERSIRNTLKLPLYLRKQLNSTVAIPTVYLLQNFLPVLKDTCNGRQQCSGTGTGITCSVGHLQQSIQSL